MPDALSHLTPQELAAYRQGRLPQAAAAAVADHLASCPACRGAAAPAPSLPPELANHPKFRIVRELGKGGMGVIYLAEHRVMDKLVALKVISPAVLDNPTAVARFLAEVRAAGKLDHENIARAYDADQAGDLHFLVMEYIEGQSLAQVLEQRGPLPVAQACQCVRQAALGLQHAFEQGMVHRDLKPHNMMLTPKGQVKILDFGLARLRDERQVATRLTRLESFMGTPEYVAPEQATDARQADTRSDIYSLGCTLYSLLAGRPPFVADTAVQIIMSHIENPPRSLAEVRPDVPAGLAAVVARMLAKDPARRYQRPSEVAEALLPFARAGSKSATAVPPARGPLVATGTVVGGDTPPERRRGKGKSKPPARGPTRGDRGEPTATPEAWWSRPPVIAAIVCAALLGLVVVAGAVVLIVLLTPSAETPAVAAVPKDPGHGDLKDGPVVGDWVPPPSDEGGRGPAPAPTEKRSEPKKGGKAGPAQNAKTPEQKKAEDDARAEARRQAEARKQADDAARREMAARKAEEERQRKEAAKKAEDERKHREALQKAETEAAAALKLAKRLLDDADSAGREGKYAEERRLKKEEYPKALRQLVKNYPGTKAAKEAQQLLDE